MKRALVVFFVFLIGAIPSSAQTIEDELKIFSEWVSGASDITNRIYGIATYSEQAGLVQQEFFAGTKEQNEALLEIEGYKALAAQDAEKMRADVRAYREQPQLVHFEPSDKIFDRQTVVSMVDELENIVHSTMDVLAGTIRGEEIDPEMEFQRGLKRLEVFAKMSDSMLIGQRQTISVKNHPQIYVVDSMMNSNRALILTEQYRGALEGYEMQISAKALIVQFKKVVKRHKSYINKGKKGQASLTKSIQMQLQRASQKNKSLYIKVLALLNAFDDAWVLEEEFISEIESFLSVTESEATGYATVSPALEALSLRLIDLEQARLAGVQNRLKMMQ